MERIKHTIDATDQTVGRLSTQVATLLRGKDKPEFQPHIDQGGIVEVTNIRKLKFTGKKLEQKKYYRHSGYPGGIKETKLEDLMISNPGEVVRKAVKQMLPNIKLRNNMLKRLIIK